MASTTAATIPLAELGRDGEAVVLVRASGADRLPLAWWKATTDGETAFT